MTPRALNSAILAALLINLAAAVWSVKTPATQPHLLERPIGWLNGPATTTVAEAQ